MKYRFLLADNDNTLMDFDKAEDAAIRETFEGFGLSSNDEEVSRYVRINAAMWRALERGEIDQSRLKVERFRLYLQEIGQDEALAPQLGEAYEENLGHYAYLLPGALSLLQAVKPFMKIALVSNGISRIQRSRLSRCPFTPLLDAVVISGEVGAAKPDPRLVEIALEQLGCTDKSQAVFLGDSLSADIAAARAAEVDSILLAPGGSTSSLPTYIVTTLEEAAELLVTEPSDDTEQRSPAH